MIEAKNTLNLIVIGPKHAGKTVYLTTIANDPEVSLSDPATIELVSLHWQTMQSGDIPLATAGTISNLNFSYHCTVNSKEYNLDFTVPDYDGHFAETLSKADESSPDIQRLKQIISEADGFIVLMPMDKEDQATMELMRYEIGSFINIVRDIFTDNSKIPAPLIIAVNKWDKSPDFKSVSEDQAALAYIQSVEIYNTLYERLKNFFANIIVLPVSAYGHQTDSAKPVAGELNPYRVTEPIRLVVEDFFANLRKTVQSLQDNPPMLAERLLSTQPLWQRVPGENYDSILKGALDTSFDELKEQLSKAQTRKEFKKILDGTPQGKLIDNFPLAQQVEIEQMELPHRSREKKKRIKIGAIAAAILLVAGFTWYLTDLNLEMKKEWLETTNAETQRRPGQLASFISKYNANPMARVIGSGELNQAQEELQQFVTGLQDMIDTQLSAFENEPDSCKVAEEAKHLLALTEEMNQSVSAHSMTRLEALASSRGEICQAKTDLQSATDDETVQRALGMLANKPDTEEVRQLKELVREKGESKRISTIRDELRQLETHELEALKRFIQTYESDRSPEVLDIVSTARNSMPEFFYNGIRHRLEGITDLKSSQFEDLKTFVRDNIQDIDLSNAQLNSVRAMLQNVFEEYDRKAINKLPDQISTQKQLDDALTVAREADETRHIALDGGVFAYTMPESLRNLLQNKVAIIDKYLNVIKNGIVADWILTARGDNAVDLDCANLLARDARLEISFSNDAMPHQDPVEDGLRCRRIDGGSYEFYFRGRVKLFNGTIFLTKVRLWPRSPLTCQASLDINVSDLFSLENGTVINKDLQYNCPGIAIKFARNTR